MHIFRKLTELYKVSWFNPKITLHEALWLDISWNTINHEAHSSNSNLLQVLQLESLLSPFVFSIVLPPLFFFSQSSISLTISILSPFLFLHLYMSLILSCPLLSPLSPLLTPPLFSTFLFYRLPNYSPVLCSPLLCLFFPHFHHFTFSFLLSLSPIPFFCTD